MSAALTDEERADVEKVRAWPGCGWDAETCRRLLAIVDRLAGPAPAPTDDIGAWLAGVSARLAAARPGPWDAREDQGYDVVAAGEIHVATVWGAGAGDGGANAALIAHAPADLARAVALVGELLEHLAESEERAAPHVESERWRVVAWLRERAEDYRRAAEERRTQYAMVLDSAADALAAQATAPPTPPARLLAEAKRLHAALTRIAAAPPWQGTTDWPGDPVRVAREALGEGVTP